MPDEVIISSASFLHNELGVIQHKGREDEQNSVDVEIKDDLGPEEDVQEASKCEPHQ